MLSTAPHGPATTHDLLRHYFGCIEIHQRADFLDPAHEFWRRRAELELLKLQLAKYDGTKESDDHAAEMKHQVDDNVNKEIAEFAIAIEDQYEKTQVLREALKKE